MKPYLPLPPSDNKLLKTIVVIQLAVVVGSFLIFREPWPAASASIALALALIFFTREPNHDERVEQLKLKAISVGFGVGLIVMTIFSLLGKIPLGITHLPALSGIDSMILVLLIALGLFYYWRWRDGRADGVRNN